MSPPHIPEDLIATLRSARRVVASTGAGVSAESGVPTFRDALTGLWAKYDPMKLGTPEAFEEDPKLVWDWFAWRRQLVQKAAPNPGHVALAAFPEHFEDFTLVTQNVDGLHRQAGSKNVLELHGNLFRFRCHDCGVRVDAIDDGEGAPRPPACAVCGGRVRPDVVWFGEGLPEDVLSRAFTAAREADVLFSIGTSAVVYPAASLPEIALSSGVVVVEVNPTPTPLTPHATHVLQGPSGEILPAILAALEGPNLT